MGDIQVRHTVESLFGLRCKILAEARSLWGAEANLRCLYDSVGGHAPYRLQNTNAIHGEKQDERSVDQSLWRYLVRLYSLEKFMLCTDFEKMRKEIDEFRTPAFTIENANGWLDGLKGLIQDNVNTLIKQVYSEITNGYYYTGGGYRGEKKKRNNNGIDERFIIYTADYHSIYSYWTDKPSVMDDLEKICYILDGKTLPEKTLRSTLKEKTSFEATNDYMSVKLCKNGNTHFVITSATRDALNRFGPTGTEIGENIKIKVFE